MTLAGSPRLTPGGAYSAAATGAGKPSGVFLVLGQPTSTMLSACAATGSAAGAVDLGPVQHRLDRLGDRHPPPPSRSPGRTQQPADLGPGRAARGTTANSIASGLDLTVRDVGDCNIT